MHRSFPLLSLIVIPLMLAGCEQKTASAPAPTAAASAPAAAASTATGPVRTISMQLVDATAVGALQYDVVYVGEGRFVGDADAVECETKIEGALSSYNHIVADKNLRSAFIAVNGFTGPVVVSECKFQGEAKAEDFTVTVKDASSPDLQAIEPAPTVKVLLN